MFWLDFASILLQLIDFGVVASLRGVALSVWALWWRSQVKTSHEVKNVANPLEPKVAGHVIDNLLSDADLVNDGRLLHHHVDKAIEQREELDRMKERNFVDTAAACVVESDAKAAKDDAEAAKPKTKAIELINLRTKINSVKSACEELCYRQEAAGHHLQVECNAMIEKGGTQVRPIVDPNSGGVS